LNFPEFGDNVAVGGGGAGTTRQRDTTGTSSHGGGDSQSIHGQPHTGGGGFGGSEDEQFPSGNGGSGSVMLRFPLAICTPCEPGTYLSSGSLECTPCLPGTFAQYPGSIVCMPCPGGTYATSEGTAVCTAASAGTFTPPIGYQGECNEICEHSSQQNAVFLKLLKDRPPIGINIFADFNHTTRKIPDARGNGYDVVLLLDAS
jgi:hypothetical protein